MLATHNDENIEALRDDIFQTLLSITQIGLWLSMPVIWLVRFAGQNVVSLRGLLEGLAPVLLLACCAFLANLLRQRSQRAAHWCFVLGLLLAPTLGILIDGPSMSAYMFIMFGLVVASGTLGQLQVQVAALAAALIFSSTLIAGGRYDLAGLSSTVALAWVPVGICLLVGVVSAMNADIVTTTVQWALDSQKKDERRAELFYRQQQELDRTLKQLTFAHSQLQTLNRELHQARQAADEANQLKTKFLANMSHELRTPLNAIINFTKFLGKERYGTLTARQVELQQRVLTNSEHLLGLINDILDLSKIEAGRMDLFYEPTDLAFMLQGVMATATGLTKEKGLELALELPDDLPPVQVDKIRIRQVLLNLLSNAAKFTEQGGIRVRADVLGDGFVQVAVQDSGVGIPADQQHLVFEEFRQVDGELTRQHQGTGLGMPISKRLVEMHGGRMWLESAPGVGTTFFFTLPAAAPQADHAPAPAQPAVAHYSIPQ